MSETKKVKEFFNNKLDAVKAVIDTPKAKKTISFLRAVMTSGRLSGKDLLEFLLEIVSKDTSEKINKGITKAKDIKNRVKNSPSENEIRDHLKEKRTQLKENIGENMPPQLKVIVGIILTSVASLSILVKKAVYCLFPCDMYPKLPDFLITNGINIPVNYMDFFDMFTYDPDSNEGKMMYNSLRSNPNGDMNTALFNTIQNGTGQWKTFFDFTYIESGGYTIPSQFPNSLNADTVWQLDVINIKVQQSWQNKSLNKFMGDLLNSMTLFSMKQLFADTLSIIFNSFHNAKSDVVVAAQAKLNAIRNKQAVLMFIDKIQSWDDDSEMEIDNSFFEFNSEQLNELEENVEKRKRGIMTFEDCENLDVKVDFNDMEGMILEFEEAPTFKEQKKVLEDSFTYMLENSDGDFNNSNWLAQQIQLVLAFLKAFIKAMILQLISPKMVLYFYTYLYLREGGNLKAFIENPANIKKPKIIEFLEKLKQPIIDLIKGVIFGYFIYFILKKLVIPFVKKLVSGFISLLKKEKREADKQVLESIMLPPTISQLKGS